MRRHAEIIAIRAVAYPARESKIKPGFPRHARQEPRASDICKEADPGFGHGKAHGLARDPMRAVEAYPDAPAHRDAVYEGDMGLAETLKRPVVLIFVDIVPIRLLGVVLAPVADNPDVAACAKTFPFRLHHDPIDMRVLRTGVREHLERPDHPEGERIQGFRPVKADETGAASFGANEFVRRFVHVFRRQREMASRLFRSWSGKRQCSRARKGTP